MSFGDETLLELNAETTLRKGNVKITKVMSTVRWAEDVAQ